MINILTAILIILTPTKAYAGKVFPLKVGQPAPFAGMLLDHDSQVRVNVAFQENDAIKSALDSQQDMLVNLNKQNVQYETQIAVLKSDNASQDFWTKVLYFVGGAIVGGAVTSVVRR